MTHKLLIMKKFTQHYVFTLLLLSVTTITAFGQIAFDAASSIRIDNGANSVTLPHTCSGTNRVLLVGVVSGQGTFPQVASIERTLFGN